MLRRLKSTFDDALDKVLSSTENNIESNKPAKFKYSRPSFLNLNEDQIQVSRDFSTRPIVVPQDSNKLPRNAGYADCINGGKSVFNEDQAMAKHYFLDNKTQKLTESMDLHHPKILHMTEIASGAMREQITVTYYGIFDGHAGPDAALMASKLLHKHVIEKLHNILEVLNAKSALEAASSEEKEQVPNNHKINSFGNLDIISTDSLIVGALEEAFQAMDDQILREKSSFSIRGGCAAIVALFVLGKLFVANAGDCRAVVCHKDKCVKLSRDLTPYSERYRILALGTAQPELLHDEFTCNEYTKRIIKSDMGKKILYRGAKMSGWGYKTADTDDLKVPLISRTQNKSRLMQTIGVSRGFGDHDLRVFDSDIYIKPFLLAIPEVTVFDIKSVDLEDEDVLIIASDGLWDVLKEEDVKKLVASVLKPYSNTNERRYISAAQDLVNLARGHFTNNSWKKKNGDQASYDDITVFVIPLKN